MRKATVTISLSSEVKDMVRSIMRYVESFKILKIIHLDFDQDLKIEVVKFRLKDGYEYDDLDLPDFLEITSILRSEGKEFIVLLKVHIPEVYRDLMEEYDRQFWDMPFSLDQDEAVMSSIGNKEELNRFIEMIESFGEINKIKFKKATFEREDLLSFLTERQKEVIQIAKDKGYYEYPRNVSLDEISEELNISKSTAVEHLRKAEQRLMSEILDVI